MDEPSEPPVSATPSRRAALLGAAASGLAFMLPAAAVRAERVECPNILFILADDLGFADVSCYGARGYRTPAIDSIAARGMLFRQAYANSAVCSATRTALITGRYQDRLAIGLEEPLVARDVGLPPAHPTLPSRLRSAGYSTWLLGKWHLGRLPKYGPLLSGYDHFWGFRGGGVDYFSHDMLGHPDLWDDDRSITAPGYMTKLLGNKAVEVIEQSRTGASPFFISLHFNAPHWPWEGPGDTAESRRLASRTDVESAQDFDGGSSKVYANMVTAMDAEIGRILAALNRTGLAENTIVVFTSDNGGERFSDTWPFSGKKTELLEGGLRIPAVINWPHHIAPGSVSDQVIMSMDWMPTFLSIANVGSDPRYPVDGIDLLPFLRGARPVSRTLCWRYLNLMQEACRSGDWKYLKILDNTFLFNVVDDSLERANLKEREPEIFHRLVSQYQEWNAGMLPLDMASFTSGFTGAEMADHFGVTANRMVPQ